MKIIKNITLFVALSMPFGASAWEWANAREKIAVNCEFIGRLSLTASLGMFVYWCASSYTNLVFDYGHRLKIENSNNLDEIATLAAHMNNFSQEAIKSEKNIRNIALISLAISIIAFKGKSFLESSKSKSQLKEDL